MTKITKGYELTTEQIRDAFDCARTEGFDFLLTHRFVTPKPHFESHHQTAPVSRDTLAGDLFTLYRRNETALEITGVYDLSRTFEHARANTFILPQHDFKTACKLIERDLAWKQWEERSFIGRLFGSAPRT